MPRGGLVGDMGLPIWAALAVGALRLAPILQARFGPVPEFDLSQRHAPDARADTWMSSERQCEALNLTDELNGFDADPISMQRPTPRQNEASAQKCAARESRDGTRRASSRSRSSALK